LGHGRLLVLGHLDERRSHRKGSANRELDRVLGPARGLPSLGRRGSATPARLYDLRSRFASNALARGITVYELARIMGTSVGMVEAHYVALLDTAHDSLLERLDGACRCLIPLYC
jgi:hypothetical protein